MSFDLDHIRSQFPILSTKIGKYPLIYFDNGATSQKPKAVIDYINKYYTRENANIHRGVHYLSQLSTENYEHARKTIQGYLNAAKDYEIIFTKGTTDGINLVASSFCRQLERGDEILISQMEHHSNIVPWQMAAEDYGLRVKYIPINAKGELDLENLSSLITDRTKLISITHISNALGTINPIEKIIEAGHKVNAKILIDAAQSLQHLQVDVQKLDCDFLVFSGHKVFGPTGVGILYGKEELLNKMRPYQGGGDMIKQVTLEKTTYNELPHKFEAGTPNIVGGIGLGKAIEWLAKQDLKAIKLHEDKLLEYATGELLKIEGLKIYGTAQKKSSTISFLIDGTHPYDIGTLLNQQGIAVRTGHHCTQPIMDFYKIPGTIRASFSFYNTIEEIDQFIAALKKALQMLQ